MVWAEFIHTTSRPVGGIPDPQLHAHVFTFNTTWDDTEERWKAGQFRELKRDAPYFQAAFRVRLAGKLQDLGFGINRKRDDFEIEGMPSDVLKRFSRRTEIIEKEAEKKGITDPDRKAELGAETREKKAKTVGWEKLRQAWDARLNDKERRMLASVHAREKEAARPEPFEAGAVDYAVEHSYVREAVVPERKLATEALKRGYRRRHRGGCPERDRNPPAGPQPNRWPGDGHHEGDAGPGKEAHRVCPRRSRALPSPRRSQAAMLARLVQRWAEGGRKPRVGFARPGNDYPRCRRHGQDDARTGNRRGPGRGRLFGRRAGSRSRRVARCCDRKRVLRPPTRWPSS